MFPAAHSLATSPRTSIYSTLIPAFSQAHLAYLTALDSVRSLSSILGPYSIRKLEPYCTILYFYDRKFAYPGFTPGHQRAMASD
jgi:hypothetical protein